MRISREHATAEVSSRTKRIEGTRHLSVPKRRAREERSVDIWRRNIPVEKQAQGEPRGPAAHDDDSGSRAVGHRSSSFVISKLPEYETAA